MQAISLFSGIGGLDLGFELVFRRQAKIVDLVEANEYRRKVLRKNFDISGNIHIDIGKYQPSTDWNYQEGIVYGGFPCKGTSCAGKRKGLEHPLSNLWFEQLRVIKEAKPKYVIIENPTGLLQRGLREVLNGLADAGYYYDLPHIVSASELGAPQRRERVFVVAYSNQFSCFSDCHLSESGARQVGKYIEKVRTMGWDGFYPEVSGVDHGVPEGLDRLKRLGWWKDNGIPEIYQKKGAKDRFERVRALGESCCPIQAAIAFYRVQELESIFLVDSLQ